MASRDNFNQPNTPFLKPPYFFRQSQIVEDKLKELVDYLKSRESESSKEKEVENNLENEKKEQTDEALQNQICEFALPVTSSHSSERKDWKDENFNVEDVIKRVTDPELRRELLKSYYATSDSDDSSDDEIKLPK